MLLVAARARASSSPKATQAIRKRPAACIGNNSDNESEGHEQSESASTSISESKPASGLAHDSAPSDQAALDPEADDDWESTLPPLEVVTPYVPKCVDPASDTGYSQSGPFYLDGHEQLVAFMKEGVARLDVRTQSDMAAYLRSEEGHIYKLGTACSGTDVSVNVASAFHSAFVGRGFRHVFSCEVSAPKQQFLMRMFGAQLPRLFTNASDLQYGSGHRAYDAVTKSTQVVEVCSDLKAGFPCTDVSNLNPSAPHNRMVIRHAGKRTGAVFRRLAEFARHQEQDLVA